MRRMILGMATVVLLLVGAGVAMAGDYPLNVSGGGVIISLNIQYGAAITPGTYTGLSIDPVGYYTAPCCGLPIPGYAYSDNGITAAVTVPALTYAINGISGTVTAPSFDLYAGLSHITIPGFTTSNFSVIPNGNSPGETDSFPINGYDNLLFLGTDPVLDPDGLLFQTTVKDANNQDVNIKIVISGWGTEGYYYQEATADGAYGGPEIYIAGAQQQDQVPEPSYGILFGIGVGMVVLLAWRTKA